MFSYIINYKNAVGQKCAEKNCKTFGSANVIISQSVYSVPMMVAIKMKRRPNDIEDNFSNFDDCCSVERLFEISNSNPLQRFQNMAKPRTF